MERWRTLQGLMTLNCLCADSSWRSWSRQRDCMWRSFRASLRYTTRNFQCSFFVLISLHEKLWRTVKNQSCVSRVFLLSLTFILQGYIAEFDNSELSHLTPPSLDNKREVLFGNLPEIYDFHNRCVQYKLDFALLNTQNMAKLSTLICFYCTLGSFYDD